MALPAFTPSGTSVGTGVPKVSVLASVEQLHGLVVHLAAAQGLAQPVVEVALVVAGQVGQRLDVVVVHGLVAVAQFVRVMGVRRDALEPVQHGVLQGADVLVARGFRVDVVLAPLVGHRLGGVPGDERGRTFGEGGAGLLGHEGGLDLFAAVDGFAYPVGEGFAGRS